MSTALAWTGAAGAAIAAITGLVLLCLGPAAARWRLRAETLRDSRGRRENALHRQRFTQVWTWQQDQPDGPERVRAARWYGEWTGADKPYRGGLDDGPQTPGLHSGGAAEAYERYVGFLAAVYEPGRLGPLRPPLQGELPG